MGDGVWELDATIDVRAGAVVKLIGEVRQEEKVVTTSWEVVLVQRKSAKKPALTDAIA